SCVLSNCFIYNNTANKTGNVGGFGGGVYCDDSGNPSCVMIGCTQMNNRAGIYGGGAYLNANSSMEDCVLKGNSAAHGGGVCNPGILRRCVLYGNSVSGNGGGTYIPKLLQNCTIVSNKATAGNGGGVYLNSSGAMTNCIVYFNLAATSNNIANGGGTIAYTCSSPAEPGVSNMDADPLFVDLASGDLHEKSRSGHWTPGDVWIVDGAQSPCIDAGDASDFSLEPPPNGRRINMGAYGNTSQASKALIRGTIFGLR
ncbi:MAG: hypothetical protein PHR35_14495, partial [Kiritimatiellae bacterium]|nr:hypothetical protein [Kiritimatiellia bacterium]